jgi:GxxExxY protein
MNMDGQDIQDGDGKVVRDASLKHVSITREVIGCAFEVINELGAGFIESVYERALLVALRQKGLAAVAQHRSGHVRGVCVGEFVADIVEESHRRAESREGRCPEHQAQINY